MGVERAVGVGEPQQNENRSTKGRLARAAGLSMALIIVSRFLGLVRERAVADIFGRTWATDALQSAFRIPDLMYFLVVGGGLSAAFIPVFSEYLATDREKEGWSVASTFINVAVLALVALTALGVLFTPQLSTAVAYGLEGEQRELLISLMRMMFPAVFFTALAGISMGVLQSYQHFATPLLGPIIYNVGIIMGAYILGPRIGIVGMAIGTVAGAVANFLTQGLFLLKYVKGYSLRLSIHHPGVQKILRLMGPSVIASSIFQLNLIVTNTLASGLSEGSVTSLNLANRLMQLPLGVFAMALTTVLFPTMSQLVARGEKQAFVRTFGEGLRTVFFLTIPSAVGLAVLGEPLVRLLFQVGAFTSQDTVATAYALVFFAPGLFSQSGIQLLSRVFYAMQDTRSPVWVGLSSLAVNTGLSLAILRVTELGHAGLALSFSLTSITSLLLYLWLLRRKVGPLGGRSILRSVAGSTFSAFVMGYAVWGAAVLIMGWWGTESVWSRLLAAFIPIGIGTLLYMGAAWLLRMQEVRQAVELIKRRLNRRSERPQPGS